MELALFLDFSGEDLRLIKPEVNFEVQWSVTINDELEETLWKCWTQGVFPTIIVKPAIVT